MLYLWPLAPLYISHHSNKRKDANLFNPLFLSPEHGGNQKSSGIDLEVHYSEGSESYDLQAPSGPLPVSPSGA